MKKTSEIILDEQDVRIALRAFIRDTTGITVDTKDLVFCTAVRGDYDRGDAESYVKWVSVEVNEE